jgi:hypothetical protein
MRPQGHGTWTTWTPSVRRCVTWFSTRRGTDGRKEGLDGNLLEELETISRERRRTVIRLPAPHWWGNKTLPGHARSRDLDRERQINYGRQILRHGAWNVRCRYAPEGPFVSGGSKCCYEQQTSCRVEIRSPGEAHPASQASISSAVTIHEALFFKGLGPVHRPCSMETQPRRTYGVRWNKQTASTPRDAMWHPNKERDAPMLDPTWTESLPGLFSALKTKDDQSAVSLPSSLFVTGLTRTRAKNERGDLTFHPWWPSLDVASHSHVAMARTFADPMYRYLYMQPVFSFFFPLPFLSGKAMHSRTRTHSRSGL